MTDEQLAVLRTLASEGYAVVVFTPGECRSADPRKIEDELISYGWDIIDALDNTWGEEL